MSGGSSSYYQPTGGAGMSGGVRTSGGSLLEPELDASMPAVLFAEFLASIFFVFLGGSAVSITGMLDAENRSFLRILTIAILDGFVFYTLIYMVMKLTRGRSGYFNSALTISLCLVDLYLDRGHKIAVHIVRAVFHIALQLMGSVLGAALVTFIVPYALDGVERTGTGGPALQNVTQVGAFFLEFFFSAFLVFVLLSVRNNENKKSSIILVFAMMTVRIILFPTTGSTLNPTRAIAHALVGNDWTHAWIFMLSPVLGATAATAGFIWFHRQDME